MTTVNVYARKIGSSWQRFFEINCPNLILHFGGLLDFFMFQNNAVSPGNILGEKGQHLVLLGGYIVQISVRPKISNDSCMNSGEQHLG